MSQIRNALRQFDPLVRAKLGIYVYALIDPQTRRVFYVGKGGGKAGSPDEAKGNSRLFSHFFEAENPSNCSEKVKTIRSIWASGRDVEWQILRHSFQDEKDAFHAEAAIIDALKLSTNGMPDNDMAGHGVTEHGWKEPSSILAFGAQAVNPTIHCRVFVFSIYKALKVQRIFDKPYEEALYEATRKSWTLGSSINSDLPMFGVGLIEGVSHGAYAIKSWVSETVNRQIKGDKTRNYTFSEFEKDDAGDASQFKNKDWMSVIGPVADYRKISGGTVVVEFDGSGKFQYIRPQSSEARFCSPSPPKA